MPSPRTSIIVLNWNKLDYTKACIESVLRNTGSCDYEIILFDNGSHEPATDAYLREIGADARIRVIASPRNLGFAGGNNTAARDARGELLLFLNNDTVVHEDWLRPMVSMLDEETMVGIVGSKLLYPDGSVQHIGVKFDHRGNRRHIFKRYPANIPVAVSNSEQEAVTGACMLIPRRLFDDAGGFDEGFLQGSEDIDLCLKVRERGYRVMFCASSVVTHFEGVSLKAAGEKFKKKTTRANNRRFDARWRERLDDLRLSNDFSGFRPYHYFNAPRPEIARLLPRSGSRILDVGCAAGLLGKTLRDQGKCSLIWGIELEPAIAKLAEQHLDRVCVMDIEKDDLPGDAPAFDCILFADVLEHVRDPWTVLSRFRRHLAPGGCVIASIPNVRHYKVVRDLLLDRWLYRDEGILDVDHVRFFGLATIRNLFRVAGYAIERIDRQLRAGRLARAVNTVCLGALSDALTQQYLVVARPRAAGRRQEPCP